MTISLASTKLDRKLRKVVEEFCNDLLTIKEIEIQSINIYGKDDMSLLIIVQNLDLNELKAIKDIVADFRTSGVNTFFITKQTLLTSTDVFPIKFIIIKEFYSLVWGEDILKDLTISNEFLRLRCEQEIKSLTLELKRFYLSNYGMRLMSIMTETIDSFIHSLRILVSLKTGDKPSFDDCIDCAAELIGFAGSDVKRVKKLKDLEKKPDAKTREEIFGGYIDAVYKSAQFVDNL